MHLEPESILHFLSAGCEKIRLCSIFVSIEEIEDIADVLISAKDDIKENKLLNIIGRVAYYYKSKKLINDIPKLDKTKTFMAFNDFIYPQSVNHNFKALFDKG